jgi:hypothetical protein
MGVFYTIHPTTDGEMIFANCESCGVAVDLKVDAFLDSESDIQVATERFEAQHVCAEPHLYGLIEYYDEERAARFYGLPHFL